MKFRETRRRDDFSLDLMPLIDVVFLLLIFFLITTSFTQDKEERIPIQLPEGVTGVATGEGDRVVLLVTADGRIEFKTDVAVQGETLEERLKSLKALKPDADILLKGDTEASHGRIVETLDLVKSSGFNAVNLVTSKPK